MSGPFGRFLTSGAFNTLVTYLLYLALLPWLFYRVSYTIAYASGIALAYVLNRYLVFRKPGGRAGPLLVALIYAGQYLVSLGLVTLWVRWFAAPVVLAPLFAILVTLPLTFLLNRRVFSGAAAERPPSSFSLPAPARLKPWHRRVAFGVLIGLPLFSLVLNAVSWLQYGVDLPFFDDWRAYDTGDIDSLEPAYLFRPVNDTLTPIGFGLDALAQRFLDGNSVAYQFLSMVTVLGLLLLLQWKLLQVTLRDRGHAAICFVFTLLMLQPGSYWGRENMAYQQALPLVFTLSAVWLAVARPLREQWALPLIFLLGMLSGMSYISGAFGALAAGAGMFAATVVCPRQERRHMLRAAGALAVAGAVASMIQVYYAVLPSKGGTHAPGMPMALPSEPDFWFFYLGKLGRSLLLPAHPPALSLCLVAAACLLIAAVAVLLARTARTADAAPNRAAAVCVVFAATAAMVLTYMMLVSAGRTHFRPPDVRDSLDVFSYAFQRFHFFWVTLLWPWVVAGAIVVCGRPGLPTSTRRAGPAIAGFLVVFAIIAMVRLGALDHRGRHQMEASFRKATVACIMEQLQKGEGINCAESQLPDLTPAYIYARETGASFVRYFPVLPLELGIDTPSPWFRLSRDAGEAEPRSSARPAGVAVRVAEESELHVNVGNAVGMASCVMIDVRGTVKVGSTDTVKLYFRPLGQQEFSETWSQTVTAVGDDLARVFSFRLENPVGFQPTMRLNPVGAKAFQVTELEVRCRLKSRYDTISPFYSIMDDTSPGRLQDMWPIGDGPGRFRTGKNAQVLLRTGHRHSMASCRLLEVQAMYKVGTADVGQLYFRPKGVQAFSVQHSTTLPVVPDASIRSFEFVAHSPAGFEDELMFVPVRRPQDVQFEDIKVKCLKRVEQLRAPG